MMKRITFILLASCSLTINAENTQQSAITNTINQHVLTQNTNQQNTTDRWSEWGLTQEEWAKYEELKKSARGIWSPNLDPLTMLGVEATTNAERKRYAELLAKKEYQRVEKEFAFQIAYSQAFEKLYPGLLPFKVGDQTQKTAEADHLIYFTKIDCNSCDKDLVRLLNFINDKNVDIYLIDSENNDDKIRDWALKNKIDIEKVKSRQITLNHDQGYWFKYAKGKIPVAFQVTGDGQWLKFTY
ncbi:TIGR03759 family integrating conjugative element protein [Pasteurella oralis]|uniref:TIGR03759 family integrating conjugative element protein n=1 Tax=Pasteurella oralis TaxID=1071947 RepID=UPI000C7E7B0D|nr:TIGR03759 family integrating conjugative element protein [Pasteurella oralis]